MADTQFRAEDWTYVPDAMGRIGQGYYKHRSHPQKTMTIEEFERKRSQPVSVSTENNEQNINKNRSQTRLHSSGQNDTALTPWSNPQKGEQTVSGSASRTPVAQSTQKTSGQSIQIQREKRQDEIEAEKEAARKAEAARKKAAAKKAEEEKRRKRQQAQHNDSGGDGSHQEDNSGGAVKVICSEMVAQGLMTARARQACLIYAHRRLPPSFMDGYHFWAVPYVRLMRRFDWATRLVAPFVHHRTQEVRYRLGLTGQGSWRGKLICALHDPLCSLWGRWIRPGDYRALYGGLDITES